LIIRI